LKDRKGFQTFLRVFCGKIAQRVTGAVKGSRQTGRFWLLPYTRIVEWGRAFGVAKNYVERNEKEADGILSYRPRILKPHRTIPPKRRTVREVVVWTQRNTLKGSRLANSALYAGAALPLDSTFVFFFNLLRSQT
jgi:hypothetical protein